MITYKLTVEQYMMKLYKCFFVVVVSFSALLVSTLTILKLLLRVYFEQDVSDPRFCVYAQLIFVDEVRQEIL